MLRLARLRCRPSAAPLAQGAAARAYSNDFWAGLENPGFAKPRNNNNGGGGAGNGGPRRFTPRNNNYNDTRDPADRLLQGDPARGPRPSGWNRPPAAGAGDRYNSMMQRADQLGRETRPPPPQGGFAPRQGQYQQGQYQQGQRPPFQPRENGQWNNNSNWDRAPRQNQYSQPRSQVAAHLARPPPMPTTTPAAAAEVVPPTPGSAAPAAAGAPAAADDLDLLLDAAIDVDPAVDDAPSGFQKPSRAGRNHNHPHETFHHQRAVDKKHVDKAAADAAKAAADAAEEAERKRNAHRGEFKDKLSQFRKAGPELDTPSARAFKKRARTLARAPPKEVLLPEAISIANLAQLLAVGVPQLQRQAQQLLDLDFAITPDYVLNAEIATLVAAEVAPRVTLKSAAGTLDRDILPPKPALSPEEYAALPLRAPVVTIMGHVDHGKTTLLDSLRKTSVAASEAGGITQHIGAFEVVLPGGKITFLDTPGHAAFETMRARGANVTDIVVLVVAADDGVMPQTREAIKHAQAAGVPVIVAVNKCDKPGVVTDKIKTQLLDYNIHVEDLGGDTMCVEVSALKGTGLDTLEESILTLAELQELRADPTCLAEGVTIESQVKKGKGNTATVLIKDGTLRVGDILVAGTAWCKVKSMCNDLGVPVKEAPPSAPVEVLGWKELPAAGERVVQVPSEDAAKRAVDARARALDRAKGLDAIESINQSRAAAASAAAATAAASRGNRNNKRNTWLNQASAADAAADDGTPAIIPVSVIIKGDVSGSVEAVVDAVAKVQHPELRVNVVASGVGAVTESDVERAYAAMGVAGANGAAATTSSGLVLGFNVRPDRKAAALAKRHGVPVLANNVIYRLMDSMREHLAGLLPPSIVVDEVGEATVAQVFEINAKGGVVERVAGCKVGSGTLSRAGQVKIVRGGKEVWTGTLKLIKHFKREVHEISKGNECGLAFDGFEDFQEGDVVVALRKTEVKRTLDS
ncbi:translation initiation factor IF-2 [Blastocladiella emersonii ATCC 22665]|nr:translation initiation factor IF-2 [Blastocladiella emersonii ATCC 22665]